MSCSTRNNNIYRRRRKSRAENGGWDDTLIFLYIACGSIAANSTAWKKKWPTVYQSSSYVHQFLCILRFYWILISSTFNYEMYVMNNSYVLSNSIHRFYVHVFLILHITSIIPSHDITQLYPFTINVRCTIYSWEADDCKSCHLDERMQVFRDCQFVPKLNMLCSALSANKKTSIKQQSLLSPSAR